MVNDKKNTKKELNEEEIKYIKEHASYITNQYRKIYKCVLEHLENIKDNREKDGRIHSTLYQKVNKEVYCLGKKNYMIKQRENNSNGKELNIIEIFPEKTKRDSTISDLQCWLRYVSYDIYGGHFTVWSEDLKNALFELLDLDVVNLSMSFIYFKANASEKLGLTSN